MGLRFSLQALFSLKIRRGDHKAVLGGIARRRPDIARRVLERSPTAVILAVVFLALSVAIHPLTAHAEEGTCCVPSDEQYELYRAEGTLDERISYQESLENDSADSWLIEAALAREGKTALQAVPPDSKSGMPMTGTAHIVLICVDFPDTKFTESNVEQLLEQLAFGGASGVAFPYESLTAYYERSSYGKLDIASPLSEGNRVFSYTAQNDRAYYTSKVQALFEEVLAFLDSGGVDFSQFDGNSDSIIDAIYLHFAGDNTGWGTTWWSQELIYKGQMLIDGVKPGNLVLLSSVGSSSGDSSVTQTALRTLIHETGHVLGLPDYYSGESMKGSPTERTGILSFDIMMQNTGDHNGFSKWMLGWLDGDTEGDDAHVVRIIANDSGIIVKKGGAIIETLDSAAAKGFGLASFTSSTAIEETGGIVVVSNDDDGIFSEYFLVQYDTFAQNQSVLMDDGIAIPSGFRMFHVNAKLNDDGKVFKYTNMGGSLYNQLIELVDPDMGQEHIDNDVPHAASGSFHCMFFEGDEVTPKSFPSSNYSEYISSGFTGISIAFTESGGPGLPSNEKGSFILSYSTAGKPSPDDFVLMPVSGFQDANNAGVFALSASYAPRINDDLGKGPYLLIDGQRAPARAISIKETTQIQVSYMVFDSVMRSDSVCELVFPEGFFIIGIDQGVARLSDELRIPVHPGAITDIALHGNLVEHTGTSVRQDMISNLFWADSTHVGFFLKKSDGIYFYKLDKETCEVVPAKASLDGSACIVQFSDNPDIENVSDLQACTMEEGRIALRITTTNMENRVQSSHVYRICTDGSVEASCSIDTFSANDMVAASNGVLLYTSGAFGTTARLCDYTEMPSSFTVGPQLHTSYVGLFRTEGDVSAAVKWDSLEPSTARLDLMSRQEVIDAARIAGSAIDPIAKDFLAHTPVIRVATIADCQAVHGVSLSWKEAGLDGPDVNQDVTQADILIAKTDWGSLPYSSDAPIGLLSNTTTLLGGASISLMRIDAHGFTSSTLQKVPNSLGFSSIQSDGELSAFSSQHANMSQAFSYAETRFLDDMSRTLSSFNFVYGKSRLWIDDSFLVVSAIEECGVYYWKTASLRVDPDDPDPVNPVPVTPAPLPTNTPIIPGQDTGLAAVGDGLYSRGAVLLLLISSMTMGIIAVRARTRIWVTG